MSAKHPGDFQSFLQREAGKKATMESLQGQIQALERRRKLSEEDRLLLTELKRKRHNFLTGGGKQE